jgi:hypothetical protein
MSESFGLASVYALIGCLWHISEREVSAEEELAAAEKGVESLTVGKGKRKAAPARAKVYATMDEPVSSLQC